MPSALPPGFDGETAAELQAIIARLSALADGSPRKDVGRELQTIRAHLARLATDNAEIGRYLRTTLGLDGGDLPEQ